MQGIQAHTLGRLPPLARLGFVVERAFLVECLLRPAGPWVNNRRKPCPRNEIRLEDSIGLDSLPSGASSSIRAMGNASRDGRYEITEKRYRTRT